MALAMFTFLILVLSANVILDRSLIVNLMFITLNTLEELLREDYRNFLSVLDQNQLCKTIYDNKISKPPDQTINY